MTAPTITIVNISSTKIGWQAGKDQCVVKFTANQVLKDFEARAGGVGRGTGLLVGKANILTVSDSLIVSDSLLLQDYTLPVGVEQQFEIDNEELQQDGDYRINIYGMNEQGEWTSYE